MFDDARLLFTVLDGLASKKMPAVERVIVHDRDRGAGGWGWAWAVSRGVEVVALPEPTSLSVGAPSIVVAFHGGRASRAFVKSAVAWRVAHPELEKVVVIERCVGERRRWWSGEGGGYARPAGVVDTEAAALLPVLDPLALPTCRTCERQGFHALEAR